MRVGSVHASAEVVRVESKGLYVAIPEYKSLCFVPSQHLSDKKTHPKAFHSGQKVKCRIIEHEVFEGICKASLKPSVLELKYLSNDDISPGDIAEARTSLSPFPEML